MDSAEIVIIAHDANSITAVPASALLASSITLVLTPDMIVEWEKYKVGLRFAGVRHTAQVVTRFVAHSDLLCEFKPVHWLNEPESEIIIKRLGGQAGPEQRIELNL